MNVNKVAGISPPPRARRNLSLPRLNLRTSHCTLRGLMTPAERTPSTPRHRRTDHTRMENSKTVEVKPCEGSARVRAFYYFTCREYISRHIWPLRDCNLYIFFLGFLHAPLFYGFYFSRFSVTWTLR